MDLSIKDRIENLVDEFTAFRREVNLDDVNEEKIKIAFVVPLLEILGWDMKSDEVLPEQRTLVGRADFGLRISGRITEVYVECKQPGPLTESHARQAIDYAWSMRADWAVLTNFMETRLYFSRVTEPSEGLIFSIKCDRYASSLNDLWLISRRSVASGQLQQHRLRERRVGVDEAFLKDLLEARRDLLYGMLEKNAGMEVGTANDYVQMLLDRIIFIRSCEDRGLIAAERLAQSYSFWNRTVSDKLAQPFMSSLKLIFRDIDAIYNGRLFEEHPVEDVSLDSGVLKSVLDRFYGTMGNSGYRFEAIPVDILGQAYELYLSSVIKEKEGKGDALDISTSLAKRKELGIYYTPIEIVDLIVELAVGEAYNRLGYGKPSEFKVLDNACGSGGFLLGALATLSGRIPDMKPSDPASLESPEYYDDESQLTILEKSLHGLDIDEQAVEITMLNLMLRAVRADTSLPYVGNNIIQGNTVVRHTSDSETVERLAKKIERILGSNWTSIWASKCSTRLEEAFPDVMAKGGFDAVVGNPPYRNMRESNLRAEQLYCQVAYPEFYRGNSDILYYFIRNGIEALCENGRLGMIVGRYFMDSAEADRLRSYILQNTQIHYIIDFGNYQVFPKQNILNAIIVLEKVAQNRSRSDIRVVIVKDSDDLHTLPLQEVVRRINEGIKAQFRDNSIIEAFDLEQDRLGSEPWTLRAFSSRNVEDVLATMEGASKPLHEMARIGVGYETGKNYALTDNELLKSAASILRVKPSNVKIESNKFVSAGDSRRLEIRQIVKGKKKHGVFSLSEAESLRLGIAQDLLRPLARARDIQRYIIEVSKTCLLTTYSDTQISHYPRAKRHLERFKKQLEARYAMPRCKWFGLSTPKNRNIFEMKKPKLIVPRNSIHNRFGWDTIGEKYCLDSTCFILPKENCPVDLSFLAAVLNSKMMEFYHKCSNSKLRRAGYYSYDAKQLRKLPIRVPENSHEKRLHDDIAAGSEDLANRLNELSAVKSAYEASVRQHTQASAKYCNLGRYLIHEGVKWDNLMETPSLTGVISEIEVFRAAKDTIVINVEYSQDDAPPQLIGALKVRFESEELCDFVSLAIRFSASSNRGKIGKGKILDILQSKVSLPVFVANLEHNREKVSEVMTEFRKRLSDSMQDFETVGKLENTILALESKLERMVRDYYGVQTYSPVIDDWLS